MLRKTPPKHRRHSREDGNPCTPLGTEEHVLLMPLKDAFAALKTPHPALGRAAVFALPLLFQKI
jgi:hypothetical protein